MTAVLAPLRLHGVGTPGVESLSSYFMRLAHAHSVKPAQMGRVLLNGSAYLAADGNVALDSETLSTTMLCSYSLQTAVLIHRLQRLTSQTNLGCGTLIGLAGNFCRNQTGALTEKRRWCCRCYVDNPPPSVEPLAWRLPMITWCNDHDIALEDRCRHCCAFQHEWRDGPERGRCVKCGYSLGQSVPLMTEHTPWTRWSQQQALRLLEHLATPNSEDFVDQAVTCFVNELPLEKGSGSCLRQIILQRRDDIANNRFALPRLTTLFKLAGGVGTTPMDILLRPKEAASTLLLNSDAQIPTSAPKRPFRAEHYQECEGQFKSLMTLPRDVLLPPACQICERCNVSASNFFQTRRNLWNAYLEEKNSRISDQREQRLALGLRYAEAAIEESKCSGKQLHLKQTVAAMMKDLRIPKRMARSALRVALVCRKSA